MNSMGKHQIKAKSYSKNLFPFPWKFGVLLKKRIKNISIHLGIFLSGTFEDKEITHVEGEVDPIRDLEIINEELRLKDEEAFMKYFDDLEKKYQRGEKKLKQEYVSQILLLRDFLLLFNHSISDLALSLKKIEVIGC